MTKKERENLRAWCESEKSTNSVFVSGWAKDTVELIDELNETEALLAANREELKQIDANSAEKDREYKKRIEEAEAERNQWKKRAEMFEEATNGFCFSCGNKKCGIAGQYHRQMRYCTAYVFDEARFLKSEKAKDDIPAKKTDNSVNAGNIFHQSGENNTIISSVGTLTINND